MIKKIIMGAAMLAVTAAPLSVALPALAATPNWNASGSYVAAFNYLGTDYAHDITLSQNSLGALTGSGGSPAGGNVYTWAVTGGSVSGNEISFSADYTATADAVTPQTTMQVTGSIASDGTMSGTWSDNYQGGARSGSWHTTSGSAVAITASAPALAAEDFGVVDYDTGLGTLVGYSAGFGLSNATFENVQSVVVKLYAGAKLLQTNTSTAKLGADITGAQISSPFDVSGNFDYAADGYWTNQRAPQYGQSKAATRVVATVTLANGTVVTAENTNLTGDPSTIFATSTKPTALAQCKDGNWQTFTNPSFKNQGQCIVYVLMHKFHDKVGHGHEGDHGHGNWDGKKNDHRDDNRGWNGKGKNGRDD